MLSMTGTPFTSMKHPDRMTWMLVGSGILALAIAMGIGRFAFTPLLPLMLRDGTLVPRRVRSGRRPTMAAILPVR